MTRIPPELEGYEEFLNGQPEDAQSTFHYSLCLMMVEEGKMALVDRQSGEDGVICVFRSGSGEEFRVVRPDIGDEDDALILRALKMILRDEGMLDD